MIMAVKSNGIHIQRLENVTTLLDNRWLVTPCKLRMRWVLSLSSLRLLISFLVTAMCVKATLLKVLFSVSLALICFVCHGVLRDV